MKAQKTCLYYLLLFLSVVTLCACSRSALPAESFQAEGGSAAESISGSEFQEDVSPTTEEAKRAQAGFDEFTDEIFKSELSASPLSLNSIVRHPENYGIVAPEMTLGEFSYESLKESNADIKQTKEELASFDIALLTVDQRFTYRMLSDFLETGLLSEGLELYEQPLSPTIGTQAQLPIIFAEYTLSDKQDIEDYLALLSDIDNYYKQLSDFEKSRADARLAFSDTTLDRIIQSCKNYMVRPESSFMTETFNDRLNKIADLTEEEKNEYINRNTTILKEHFIPAYENLSAELEALKGTGKNESGLYYFDDGKKYYEYLVASATGTTSSIPELRRRIEKMLGQDLAEISLLADKNPNLVSEFDTYAFSLSEPTAILDGLKEQSTEDFPALLKSTYTVKQVPKALESSLSPAFFLVPPIDDYENGTIYLNGSGDQENMDLYPTLAHEGYPGHLYQTLYAAQKNSPPLRHLLGCNGYSEGWGTYAEIYSYSFANGISKDMQKILAHNQASTLALYAILDIRIHYEGWDLEKTADFLETYYVITDIEVVKEIFESIVDNPSNYLTYYTGYLEILSMRNTAEYTLGNLYNPKEFHEFILNMEGASFRVIEPYFQSWLSSYKEKQ